jgi:stress responsive alpha/beta barrel protein
VPAEKKAEFATRFLALKDLAKRNGQTYIISITGGKAASKEGFDQGLEQAFVVTFKNEADRNFFVGKPYSDEMDPAHEALVQIVVPLVAVDSAGKLTGLFVFDFNDDRSAR